MGDLACLLPGLSNSACLLLLLYILSFEVREVMGSAGLAGFLLFRMFLSIQNSRNLGQRAPASTLNKL